MHTIILVIAVVIVLILALLGFIVYRIRHRKAASS